MLMVFPKLWDLLEGKELFHAAYPKAASEYDDQIHLAYITALLGPIPKRLINGERASMFYETSGKYGEQFAQLCVLLINGMKQDI